MSMYTRAMLNAWLKDIILVNHPGTKELASDGGIVLLTSPDAALSSEYLYIGTSDIVTQILESMTHSAEYEQKPSAATSQETAPAAGICLISAGPCSVLADICIPEHITLIETSLPVLELYNRVHEYLHRFRVWDTGLQRIVDTNAGLQALLEQAYKELPATILLVNAGYKKIAAVYDPHIQDSTADELRENGYQSFDTIQSIHHQQVVKHGENMEYAEYISDLSHNYTIVRLIHYRGELVARLCVIVDGPAADPCISDFNELLSRYVADYMLSNHRTDYSGNAQFGALAADLIECRIANEEELQQRLKQIKLATRRYYHVMLINFPSDTERNKNIPWNYIINQLEYLFPFSNITTYKGEILLLIRKMKRRSRLSFNQETLLKLLESYNGFACVGNASEFLMSLPPVYHQTHESLRIGQKMHPAKRIYYYEDYSIYHIIEMAAESSMQKLGSRNLVHLCNNELVGLLLYDKKHNTNLVQILQAYLEHERNTTEAAKSLFIHRNTMLNKVHKIEEIIDSSLDEPMLRERLLFSCRVIEYMSRYCHEDILELKRNMEKENEKRAGT